MKVRLRAERHVYEVWFKNTSHIIQVKRIQKRKRSMEHMYRWKPGEIFNDVKTLNDLRQRMAMADVMKKLN